MKNLVFYLLLPTLFFISSCSSSQKMVNEAPSEPTAEMVESTIGYRGMVSEEAMGAAGELAFSKKMETMLPAYNAYVMEYSELAISEMQRTGIPASIKLAQAILESGAGRSAFAQKTKNHFGIKCGGNWDGNSFEYTDDDTDENGNLVKSCFRVYESAHQSYLDHSAFLTDPAKEYRYGGLFDLRSDDYIGWAWGLQLAGYATNPYYANRLIKLIEELQLSVYDRQKDRQAMPSKERITIFNGDSAVISRTGETIEEIAMLLGLDPNQLVAMNHYRYRLNQQLDSGTPVYLEKAGEDMNTRQEDTQDGQFHKVRSGETLYGIARKFGTTVARLRELNNLSSDVIAFGQHLRIR